MNIRIYRLREKSIDGSEAVKYRYVETVLQSENVLDQLHSCRGDRNCAFASRSRWKLFSGLLRKVVGW